MKKFTVAAFLAFALISLNACRKIVGEGPLVKENRNTSSFVAIRSEIPGELLYVPADEYKIEIEAQQNIINVIETSVSNNELNIKVRNNTNIRSNDLIRVTVAAPEVNTLTIGGSGAINVLQPFSPQNMKLIVNGSGKIGINMLNTDKIQAVISGSGDVQVLNGTANTEDITISGSGNIDLINVASKKATTQTSGSGTIKVNVSEELFSRISGSGTVYYTGAPAVNANISGSGRVIKL